jgi:hypothetical protein
MVFRRRNILRPGLFVVLLLSAIGCSGKGSISGTVTYKGEKLPNGAICFHQQDGNRDVFNAAVRNGEYSIDGVPTGPTKVTVVSAESSGAKGDFGAKTGPNAAKFELPRRYADPNESGLTLTVQGGRQPYNVDLIP